MAVVASVLKFINRLKQRVNAKGNQFFTSVLADNFYDEALTIVIRQDQSLHFPDVVRYFESPRKTLKNIPPLITQ